MDKLLLPSCCLFLLSLTGCGTVADGVGGVIDNVMTPISERLTAANLTHLKKAIHFLLFRVTLNTPNAFQYIYLFFPQSKKNYLDDNIYKTQLCYLN